MNEKEWWDSFRTCRSGCGCESGNVGHEGSCAWVWDVASIIAEAEKRVLNRPMGVSEWREHGKKYGYNVYFAGRMRDTISRVVYENVFGDARPSLSCQPYELVEKIMESLDSKQDFDPKHPRCPKCGELMKKESEYTWMCECSPDLRLSIG